MDDPDGGHRPLLLLPERVPPALTGGLCADDGLPGQTNGAGFIPFVFHGGRLGVLILRSAIREIRLNYDKQAGDREGLTGRMDQYEMPGGACDGHKQITPYKAAYQELWEEGSGLFHVEEAALKTLHDAEKVVTVGACGRPGYRAFYGLLAPMDGLAFPMAEAQQQLSNNYTQVHMVRQKDKGKVPSCWCENDRMTFVPISNFLKSYKTTRYSSGEKVELRSLAGTEAANHLVTTAHGTTVALFARDANALIKLLEKELGPEALAQGVDYEHSFEGKADTMPRNWEVKLKQALEAHTIRLTTLMDVTEEKAQEYKLPWLAKTKEYLGSIM